MCEKGGAAMTTHRNKMNLLLMLAAVFGFWLFLRPIVGVQKGSIRIHLQRINVKQELIELSLYDVSEIVSKNPSYHGKENTQTMIQMMEREAERLNLVPFVHVNDEKQMVEWQELAKGTYLIVQKKAASFGVMEPILITLPMHDGESKDELMNVVIEPAIVQPAENIGIDAQPLMYLPNESISLKDVIYLFAVFALAIIILSLWKYQREQREI